MKTRPEIRLTPDEQKSFMRHNRKCRLGKLVKDGIHVSAVSNAEWVDPGLRRDDDDLVGYRQTQRRDLGGAAAAVVAVWRQRFHAFLRRAQASAGCLLIKRHYPAVGHHLLAID